MARLPQNAHPCGRLFCAARELHFRSGLWAEKTEGGLLFWNFAF